MTIPWQLLRLPMNQPQLRGANPQQIQAAPPVALPQPPTRSNLLSRLFPGGQLGGLLDPDQLKGLQRQGLLQLGLGLLANSGPRVVGSPGSGFGERIAGAFQGTNWQQMMQNAVQQTMALSDLSTQQQLKQKRAAILKEFTTPANETPQQREVRLGKMVSAFSAAGLTDDAKDTGALIGQLRGADLGESDGTLYRKDTGEVVGRLPQDPTDRKSQQDYFTRADQLYGQFLQQTAKERDIALNYNALLAASNDPSAAGDVALIFSFMRMLDPGSTVREGEFATAANTGSIPQRVWAQYNKAISGERLTTDQRADFTRQAQNRARGAQRSLGRVIQEYGRRGERFGLNPNDVAYDYFSGLEIPSIGDSINSKGRPPLRLP